MRKILLLTLCILLGSRMFGQDLINIRQKTLHLPADSISLDSLSIVPGSFEIKLSSTLSLPDSVYRLDALKSLFYPSEWLKQQFDSVFVTYRVFPFNWTDPVQHKNRNFNRIDPVLGGPVPSYKPVSSIDPFADSEIISNGNISRGLMVGNTRDPSLSSNLNLQLNGKINKDFYIEANLSDANIPIQPEGNTQQIQDFDRLYMRVYNPRNEILGGDFVLQSPSGYFLRMNKKVQGARLSTQLIENQSKKTKLTSSMSGAVVKGKYTLNKINGQEGNQGPYRLTGQNGETYIQVIAGSEKVYIDGLIQTRGEQNDYVIDYNTAEIRFTPKNLITKDKRISIEFEYTEQSYARFLLASNTDWEREKGNWYLHFFTEQDAKNQPLLQDLSVDQKSLLGRAGDQTANALVPNFFPTQFSNDRVLYKLTDTLVNGIVYDSILVYSIHPDSAQYQAGFSFAGKNMGNYEPVSTSANGQVYKWIAPSDGIPQGSYAPYTHLIAPKSKQVFIVGGKEQLGSRMDMSVEMALTGNDLNSFSDYDDSDNIGYGLTSRLIRKDPLNQDSSLVLSSEVEYRSVSKNFDPVERFRSVEFERDWNLDESSNSGNENFIKTRIAIEGEDSIAADYQFEYLSYKGPYRAFRHLSRGDLEKKGWSVNWTGSHMNSTSNFADTRFSRHTVRLNKEFSGLNIFAMENHEGNIWTDPLSDNPGTGSFRFQEWKFGLENSSGNKIPWFLHFTNRTDLLPKGDSLVADSKAWQIESGLIFQGKKGGRTSLSANFRDLKSYTSDPGEKENEQSLSSRIEENFQFARGSMVSRTFYEIGSGLERKMEYTYLQVSQGQGQYTWSDYNQNNIKELDEFEPANFRDQAEFIRVFRPGTSYIPTYLNRFNQVLNIQPGQFFRKQSKTVKTISRFSNSLAFRVDKKSYRTNIFEQLSPFPNHQNDSLLVSNSTQFRNTLSFNKSKPVFGIDYHFENNQNQTLLSYGTDKRSNKANRVVIRLHPLEMFWISNLSEKGEKAYSSSFFAGKNYDIDYLKNDIDLIFKPGDKWQTGLSHEWRKESTVGQLEGIRVHRLETSLTYQMPAKGMIQLNLNYLAIQFEGNPNSPIGYVLLQGFRPGNNGMLSLSVRRKLNKLIQLDFSYEGRIAQGSDIIHTANMQVRAVF